MQEKPSLRLTTRQNIQFYWVWKRNVPDLTHRIAETGFYGLNGCGDNARLTPPGGMKALFAEAHPPCP